MRGVAQAQGGVGKPGGQLGSVGRWRVGVALAVPEGRGAGDVLDPERPRPERHGRVAQEPVVLRQCLAHRVPRRRYRRASDSSAASCAGSIVRQRDARAKSSGSSGATDATNDANSGLALSIASATVPPVDRRSDSSSLGAATTAAALTRSAVTGSAGEGVGTAGRHAQYGEPVDAEQVGDRHRVVRDRGLARLVHVGDAVPRPVHRHQPHPGSVRRRRARSSRRAGCRGSRGRTPPACPPDRRRPRAGRVDRREAAARRCRSSHEPRHFW